MRRFLHAAALIGVGATIGFGTVVVTAGAATSPPSTHTTLNVLNDAGGNPAPVRVAAGGFTPGSLVYIEQCDGNAPTSIGWSPTSNCDLGTSPSPVIADANGNAVWQPQDPNFAFTPFRGQSPQGLFNCLSPNGATLQSIDGVPDYRNCQVRVSSNNTSVTADQQFLDLVLPELPWAPEGHDAGSCTGQRIIGTWKPTPLANAAASDTLGTALMKDTSTKAALNGTCTLAGVPGTLTPHSFSMKVGGNAACTDGTTSVPLVGKLSITMNEIDPGTGKAYAIQAYVRRTPGVDPAHPDIVLYQGTIAKGPAAGYTISGTLFEDPVVKAPKGTVTQTGYVDAHTALTDCQAGTATITTVEIGAGTSAFGGTASGLHFGY